MALLNDLLAATHTALSTTPGIREQPIDSRWAQHSGQIGEQPVVLRSWAWATPALHWLRISLIDGGPRVQIFSMLSIPEPAFDLPLFGAEVVCISGAVTVVALDWMPLFPDSPYIAGLPAVRQQFDHFPPGGEFPAWAAESFSPSVLFSRPRGAIPDADILRAFTAYFTGYVDVCAHATPHGDPQQTHAAQHHYCIEHATNDPGGNMIAKMFGAEWAAQYAHSFLFRLDRASA
jgi:hypothetical protein